MDYFVPNIYQKSIFSINYKELWKNGIKCLLFDLDNTIAPVSVKALDKKTKDLFEDLKDMGFKVIIISNSSKGRVEPFKDALNVDAAHSARKPLRGKYNKIMRLYDFLDFEIAAIGDQLLTDVYGSNRMGFTSILVNPISKNDLFWTKFNRMIERRIIKKLVKKGLFNIGEYHD